MILCSITLTRLDLWKNDLQEPTRFFSLFGAGFISPQVRRPLLPILAWWTGHKKKRKKKKERNLPGFPSSGGGSSHPIYFYKDAPPFEEHNATTPSTFRVKDFYYFRTSHFCRESVLCVQVTLSYAYFLLALLPDYFIFYLLSWPFELNYLTDRPPARLSASFEYFNAALLRIVSTE